MHAWNMGTRYIFCLSIVRNMCKISGKGVKDNATLKKLNNLIYFELFEYQYGGSTKIELP